MLSATKRRTSGEIDSDTVRRDVTADLGWVSRTWRQHEPIRPTNDAAADISRFAQVRDRARSPSGPAPCSTPPARQPVRVGADPHEGPVVVALDDGGVDGGDLHRGAASQTRLRPGARGSWHLPGGALRVAGAVIGALGAGNIALLFGERQLGDLDGLAAAHDKTPLVDADRATARGTHQPEPGALAHCSRRSTPRRHRRHPYFAAPRVAVSAGPSPRPDRGVSGRAAKLGRRCVRRCARSPAVGSAGRPRG